LLIKKSYVLDEDVGGGPEIECVSKREGTLCVSTLLGLVSLVNGAPNSANLVVVADLEKDGI
jgi:hypothetical protein